ncbi:acid protease [Tilletiaria anomala UBC 951]|uniref:Acid protease n=1 Tax=Tilletiaria anomala (strain ATCC 24038 / CBS 436.72 / UBC 951) TaxID=1037660 RepID=A0A066WK60_TILAU|nr:acid protease [Tilletiaria anomala UBC 951]KDN51399.1 acid protease [Tilletiaria anomala UBC 951]
MQLTSAVLAAALAASVISAPVRKTSSIEVSLSKRGFLSRIKDRHGRVNYPGLHKEIAYLKYKYHKSLENYKRNNQGEAHPFDRRSEHAARGSGAVSLQDVSNQELWVGAASFGGQSIQFDFDTGSAGTICNAGAYSPGSSARNTGTTFHDSYGDGTTASGEVYTDILSIGGLNADGATIGLATQQFVSDPDQGIAGMGFPSLASFQQRTPLFYSLINAGVLDEHAFIFRLSTGDSTLTLGQTDSKVNFTPVTHAAYWSISGAINGKSINGIIDSGTTLIVAPTNEAQSLFDSLGLQSSSSSGQLTATYDCSKPPSVIFTFSGASIRLGKYTAYGTDDNGNCVLSIVGADIGSAGWIIGDPLFLSSGEVVFDVANKQVGFA